MFVLQIVVLLAYALTTNWAGAESLDITKPQVDPLQGDSKATTLVAFELWARAHGRSYLADPVETAARFENYCDTVRKIAQHASTSTSTMTLGLNNFADWTDAEFRQAYISQGHQSSVNGPLRSDKQLAIEDYAYAHDVIVEEVDWRTKGIVGPVKDQHPHGAPCGCCWSFATTAAAECANAMYTGKVISISEQQLIDCDRAPPFEDLGCKGGDFTGGFHYIIANGGINTEEAYPYVAHDQKCDRKKEARKVVTLDAWEVVPPGNETALQQAVARHPVAVGVCVGPGDNILYWRAYTGGIFDGPTCEKPIDHAMLIVGYGSENGTDFWLAKNSWGQQFGEAGYMRFRRGMGGFGANSITHEPAYAIKLHDNPKPEPDTGTIHRFASQPHAVNILTADA